MLKIVIVGWILITVIGLVVADRRAYHPKDDCENDSFGLTCPPVPTGDSHRDFPQVGEAVSDIHQPASPRPPPDHTRKVEMIAYEFNKGEGWFFTDGKVYTDAFGACKVDGTFFVTEEEGYVQPDAQCEANAPVDLDILVMHSSVQVGWFTTGIYEQASPGAPWTQRPRPHIMTVLNFGEVSNG